MEKVSLMIKCNIMLIVGILLILCSCGKNNEEPASTEAGSTEIAGQAIDLGLSVKWATYNLGATNSEEYGGLYGWADFTGEKTSINLDDYPSANPPLNICDTKYDIAKVMWGERWRLPSLSEMRELFTKCTHKWITYINVQGMLFVGPNGNSIFFPAAGDRYPNKGILNQGTGGWYWSGTLGSGSSDYAHALSLCSSGMNWSDCCLRSCGFSVRPVKD